MTGPNVLSLISTLNSFFFKIIKEYINEKKEYMLILMSYQYFVKSNIENNEEEDIKNICKDKHKPAKTI